MRVKCDSVKSLSFRAATTSMEHIVFWHNENPGADITALDDCAEWTTFKARFRQFKVTYVVMRVDLTRFNNVSLGWTNMNIASSTAAIQTIPLSDN